MSDLQSRLAEVMAVMSWEHSDLVRVSRQSSSVVSQWLGKGSKVIKTIGKLEAAIYIERESGFSALWVAKGLGPKRVTGSNAASMVASPPGLYLTPSRLLDELGLVLARVSPAFRSAVANNLSGWALDGGAAHWKMSILPLLTSPQEKQAKHG